MKNSLIRANSMAQTIFKHLLASLFLVFMTVSLSTAQNGSRREIKFLNATNTVDFNWVDNLIKLQLATNWASAQSGAEARREVKQYNSDLVIDSFIVSKPFDSRLWGAFQAIVVSDKDVLVIAFRGTKTDDWRTLKNVLVDANATKNKLDFIETSAKNGSEYRKIKVHAGFYNEYAAYRKTILKFVRQYPNKEIYVTGHSLGGALATLCSFDIAVNENRAVNSYIFASPRVGGEDFRKAFNEVIDNGFRITINKDPISKVPNSLTRLNIIDYEHVGRLLQLYTNGNQVPLDKIDASLKDISDDSFSLHDRSVYTRAIEDFQKKYNTKESLSNLISLWEAAKTERELAAHKK